MLSFFFVASLLSHLSVVGHTLVVSPPIESGFHERRFNADDGQIVGQRLMKLLVEAEGAVGGDALAVRQPAVAQTGTTFERARDDSQEAEASQQHFMNAQTAFDDASSHSATPEEQAIKKDLAKAMATPSTVGIPERRMPVAVSQCQPDLTKCPRHWDPRGVLCYANPSYTGPCALEADLINMNVEEKLAFSRFCKVDFPCQEDCLQDFASACPSMWQQLHVGCVAPAEYIGECNRFVDTSEMLEKDKFLFGLNCGARWPCMPPPVHLYEDLCPQGWVAEFGQICGAPHDYEGPCGHIAQMRGMRQIEKKRFEAACAVSWPVMRSRVCERDYNACPLGWLRVVRGHAVRCKAPLTYNKCRSWQEFTDMPPVEKEQWQHLCGQNFPCLSRHSCEKDWSDPCPAGWYAVDGALACVAPSSYSGNCSSELRGVLDFTQDEKHILAKRCSVSWPCKGEVFDQGEFMGVANSNNPRRLANPARYVVTDGAIDHDSGAVGRSPA